MFFLNTLPVQLKPCVRDLVIAKLLLAADDGPSRAAWERNETGSAFFTDFLADSFPNLRTVAIEVPGTYEGMDGITTPRRTVCAISSLKAAWTLFNFFTRKTPNTQ